MASLRDAERARKYGEYVRPKGQRPHEEHGDRDQVTRSHPAFGLIGASRGGVGGNLFGSPIKHNSGISITIYEAQEEHSLNRDWYHQRSMVCEVHLSEAQWATFVSTLNVGSGVPCTFRWKPASAQLQDVPPIVDDFVLSKSADDIARSAGERARDVKAAYAVVEEMLDGRRKMNKSELERIKGLLIQHAEHAEANAKYLANSLTEHLEKATTAAKAELSAFATRLAMNNPQVEGQLPTLQLEDKNSLHENQQEK
jgi:hypothetical protein